MAGSQSPFVWYELMTTDEEGAKSFYGKVVGWGIQDWEGPMKYAMFTAEGGTVAGVMALPEEARKMGAPTHWTGYVGVEDVDAATRKVKEQGGKEDVPPSDIPEVGRFCVVADPQGASFALFKPLPMEQEQPRPSMQSPGGIGWHELYAVDAAEAFDFYSGLFGWTKSQEMDMGEMGKYHIFNIGEQMIGGMMNKPPQMPVPAWLYYFNVGDIDEAAARVKDNGGQVLNGPMEVPGGGWILQGMDPQGGMFALFGSKG
jgi:predicted enzyme related to lactoylglutathione lyase